jgi:Na+/H+ antiporter NhaC
MPNTKAIGVAYSDPQFDSLTVTGASALAAVTATSVTTSGTAAAGNAVASLYFLTTAITANSTTTTAAVGSLATTTNATGLGKLFIADGTKWQYPVVA